ncbi:uncharacterized protein LOC113294395 [Papaver somniferum]|uniref:uncharacterized protein LOC113294395 n=1 Tax=Papaver somniferum TaxID=3469 RepID=UPI000E6F9680|nr:uncharacterized protein LOC113294395 [Papaver somniferum]
MVIHNSLLNKKGNIWLFWNNNLPTPTVVSMSSQMITVNIGGNLISGVHAHVGAVQRRNLWSEMEVISDLKLLWLAIGDFNTFLTSEEKSGGRALNTRNMLEFNNCLDKCEIQQASKSGCEYSWSNCQHGAKRILCNLDREVINNLWVQKYTSWSYKVGLRIASDHSPLLGGCVLVEWNWKVFGNVNEQIKEATKEVQDAMKLSDDNPFNEELLENLVTAGNKLNSKEVQLSTMLKFKARTKWVKEGSANTNFFHTKLKEVNISEALLDVIPSLITAEDQEMLDAIPSMEKIKQIVFKMDPDSSPGPDGFSGSFYRACWMIIQDDVVNAVQFCWKRKFIPKGLNFNFLVLLPKVEGARSPQQYRSIGLSNVSFKNFTKIIASRMSGLMHKLVSPQQAPYIKGRNIQDQIILASEMVNEMKKKRRNGNIGLKLDISQAYDSRVKATRPLSPLLFVLMEDVLSRNITKLVMEDDVFIFCNGAKKSIQNLMKLLEDYQDSSSQVINKNKSKVFVDGTIAARVIQIKEMMQMEVSKLPDKYLGVILHAGRVKIATVWPMVEMMQNKLARWKGKLLYFNDRLSGDGDIRKFKTLSWKKVCSPYSEGGLGLQRLKILNKALLMKILWRIINSEAEWALFIKAKFQDKKQQWKCNWKLSSICPGLKGAWNHLKENIKWCLGNGQKMSFWYDSWLGNTPIIEEVGLTEYVKNHINLKVSDLILEGKWNVPEELKPIIAHYTLPEIGVGEDILVWKEDIKGNFTTSSAINSIRNKEQPLQCYKKIWNSFLHPSIASNIWKILQGVYVDDSVMIERGFELASRCCICEEEQDNMQHFLLECKFSKQIWHWICPVFNFQIPKSLEEVWRSSKSKSPFIKECWIIAACAILKEIWFQKNKMWFEQIKPNLQSFKARIKKNNLSRKPQNEKQQVEL